MRELFINLETEQKENLYQQLCKYIEDDNLDAIQDILKYKINLTYKLKNFTLEAKAYLDEYVNSPLGMALHKDKKILKELLFNCCFENLELHGPVYLYLAAKTGDENSLFFADQLINLFFKNNIKLNVDFLINDKVCDLDVVGQKDFVEIAIENNNELFLDWALNEKFIESKVFAVKIYHIQNAIKNLSVNILKKLFIKNKIHLNELIQGLEEQFLYITDHISYIRYLENFDFDLYQLVGEILFTQAIEEKNFPVVMLLLKKRFFFEVNNIFYMNNFLSELQKKYPEEQLLFIAMHHKNYGLAKILLQFNKISIESLIQYHIQNDYSMSVECFESIHNHLNRFLLEKNDPKTWLDLFKIIDASLYYRIFKVLINFKKQLFEDVIQSMFQFNLSFIVLEIFFEVIEHEDYNMLNKFLSLPDEYKIFLLDGDDKQTALSIACSSKCVNIVKKLLEHMNSSQINQILYKNNYYKNITALWIALAFQFPEGVQCLLEVPGIEFDTGKGEHYKFKNSTSVSCKELHFLSKLEDKQKTLGFYTLYNNQTTSHLDVKTLATENEAESSNTVSNNVDKESGDVQLNLTHNDDSDDLDINLHSNETLNYKI